MNNERGFTLIELMVTISVAAILVFVAVPSFGAFMRNSQLSGYSNTFYIGLRLARSEALKRNAKVSICASSNGTTCSSSTDWATGWVVFTDSAGVAGVLDATDELLKTHEAFAGSTTLVSGGETSVKYNSRGWRTDYDSGGAANIIFTLTHPSCEGDQKRTITISPMGTVEIARVSC